MMVDNIKISVGKEPGAEVYVGDTLLYFPFENSFGFIQLPYYLDIVKEEARQLIVEKGKEIENKIREIYEDCKNQKETSWIAEKLFPIIDVGLIPNNRFNGYKHPLFGIPQLQIYFTGIMYLCHNKKREVESPILKKLYEGIIEELSEVNKMLEDWKFLILKNCKDKKLFLSEKEWWEYVKTAFSDKEGIKDGER